jgi:hypothetical protein
VKHKLKKVVSLLTIVSIMWIIYGCATKNITGGDAWDKASESTETSVVFGRLLWIEDGVEKKHPSIWADKDKSAMNIELLHLEERTWSNAFVDVKGKFAWSLKPGLYVIKRIVIPDTWSSSEFLVPKVGFLVPEKGKIYDIGVLKAHFKRNIFGELSTKAEFSITDQGTDRYTTIAQNLGKTVNDIEKSYMVYDENLPTTYGTTSEYMWAIDILINAIIFIPQY